MLPFFGRCHIGYIPNGKVFGVSKLARLVDVHARRLQLQERLTEDISREIMESIDAKGVGVMIEARHLCMMMRGVEKQNSTMVRSSRARRVPRPPRRSPRKSRGRCRRTM